MPASSNLRRMALKWSIGTVRRHFRSSSCPFRAGPPPALGDSAFVAGVPAAVGRGPPRPNDGLGSTWPENNSHSPMPMSDIALMAPSSGRVRKLYDWTPIRTPSTRELIGPSASESGSPASVIFPNSRLVYMNSLLSDGPVSARDSPRCRRPRCPPHSIGKDGRLAHYERRALVVY